MKGSVPRAGLVAFLGLHMQHSLGQDTLVAGFLAEIILCVVSSLAASFPSSSFDSALATYVAERDCLPHS